MSPRSTWERLVKRRSHSNHTQPPRREEGAALILVLLLILSFLSLAGFVVDSARIELAGKEAQNAADSLALAGAVELNGTEEGWERSKFAIFAAFRENSLFGAQSDYKTPNYYGVRIPKARGSGAKVKSAKIAPLKGSALKEYIERTRAFRFEDLTLEIERGVYRLDHATSAYQFFSLEDGQLDPLPTAPGLSEPWDTAHAVRVRIKVRDIDYTFSKVIPGMGGASASIEKEALSAKESFRS